MRGSPKKTIPASGGLGLLQMVSELDTSGVLAKRLSLEGGRHEVVCQQRCWALKEGGLGGPTSIGEGNEY